MTTFAHTSSHDPGAIRTHRDGNIGIVTIAHEARRNAMTQTMWADLAPAFAQLVADDEVRVIILRGAGEQAFISGADISEFEKKRTPETAREYERINEHAFEVARTCPKPLIAMIHGFCMGGGVGLAISADLRICADDAVFGVPAARLGLGYPPESLKTLLALVGPSRTKELFFTAARYSAQQALAMGLVSRVVEKQQLEAETLTLARTIAANAPLTLRAIKTTLLELDKPFSLQNGPLVAQAVQRCFDSDDYQEGVRAFLEKRSPQFRGR